MGVKTTSPNTERKTVKAGVMRKLKGKLKNRQTFIRVVQALYMVVKLARAMKDLFGGP